MTTRTRSAYEAAFDTLRRLRADGFRALFAGGCVRDRLLGRTPKDYDVATNATPECVLRLFPRARAVGAKFGVVLVHRFRFDIEVATFRSDGEYTDGRHPNQVTFGTEVADAQRRDFTINGLFFDPIDEKVIDHVGGRADLAARVLRTIGDPEQRFREDHLRMLRAVRFAAELDFEIDAATFAAMRHRADQLRTISPERVWMELTRILASPRRGRGWKLLVDSELRRHLSPEWPGDADGDETALRRLDRLPHEERPAALGLAAAITDVSPREIAARCRLLRLSNAETDVVEWLVRSLSLIRDPDRLELADLKLLLRNEAWSQLVELLAADLGARNLEQTPVEVLVARARKIPPDAIASRPLLTGDELMHVGFQPGSVLGELLRGLTRAQLNEEIRTKQEAWEWIETRQGKRDR